MQDGTKAKIRSIVANYERVFADEFTQFKASIPQRVELRKDKFGEVKNTDFIVRRLVEWPETLYQLLQTALTAEEMKELFEDHQNSGINWFAREFPQYRYAEKV